MIANVRRFFVAVPAVVISLISHAGVCPACWPLLGGLMSSLGVTFLFETRYLLPLMIGCLALAVGALSYGARRDYRPVALGIAASVLVLIGRFVVDAALVTIVGACLLVGAYVWSFWSRRQNRASSCQSCGSAAEPINAPKTPMNLDLPIACALDQEQFAERKRIVDRLAQEATERRSIPDGVSLSFEAVSGRVTELAKLVDMERSCCPFLTFRIEAKPGELISLELTGPVPAQELILELIPEVVSNA